MQIFEEVILTEQVYIMFVSRVTVHVLTYGLMSRYEWGKSLMVGYEDPGNVPVGCTPIHINLVVSMIFPL